MREQLPLRQVAVVGQYLLAVAAFAFVLDSANLPRLLALFGTMDAGTVALLFGVSVLGIFAIMYTWHAAIGAVTETTIENSVSIGLIILFVNNLFPSQLSGRSAAPILISLKTDATSGEAVAVAILHTGLGALLYVMMSIIGVVYLAPRVSPGLTGLVFLSIGFYLVASVGILLLGRNLDKTSPAVERLGDRLSLVPVVGPVIGPLLGLFPSLSADAVDTFEALLSNRRLLALYVGGWTTGLAIMPGIRIWLLFGAFGVSIGSPAALPFYLVAAYSVSVIPITPGGIGVTEATATAVLVGLGFPIEVTALVILIDRFLALYLPALIGWLPAARTDWTAALD